MRKLSVATNFKILFYVTLSIVTVMFLMPVPEATDSLINDKLAHGLIFLTLAFLIDRAYRGYKFLTHLASILIAYGLLIEILQGFSEYRSFSIFDWGADIIGIFSYALFVKIMPRKTQTNISQS